MKLLSERFDAGEEIASYHRILTTENKWLAARYGLDAPVMDLATGRRIRVPLAKLVRRTCETSSRTRATSAPSASWRGLRRSCTR